MSMTQAKPNPIFRLMPSFTDVAFLMPLVFLFTRMEGVRTMLGDGDTGWHIRTGEWILAHGRVPTQDIFSFSIPGHPWFAWEWLWDIGAASLHQRWGLAGVLLASILVICTTFALLYRVVNRRCGNPMIAIALTLLAAAGSTIHWLARPHLFTLLFTVVFLAVLERVREGRTHLLWWLPVLTIVWTNLHGGFLAGILILGAYGAGELARALLGITHGERVAAARASLPYLATAAGCLAASLVNPYSYHLHVHIWQYLHDPYEMKNIMEFQSANFQSNAAIFFEAMLALGLGAALWYGVRKRFTEICLLAGWAHVALISGRNIPIYMIVAAPIAAAAAVEWLSALSRAPLPSWLRRTAELVQSAGAEIGPIDRLWRVHAVSAAALVVIGLGMAAPSPGRSLKPAYDEKVYPAAALKMLDPAQRVFAPDTWGGYLIYRLSPNGTKVFIDGRSDYYGGKFCQEYVDLMGVKYDWEKTLSRYGVDTILLPTDTPLAGTVKESSHWQVVYDDGVAIVFRPARGAAEQTSSQSTGGRGHDRWISQPQTVISKDHQSQPTGANPL